MQKSPSAKGIKARVIPWFHSPVLAGSWNDGEAGILALPLRVQSFRPLPFDAPKAGLQLRDSAGLSPDFPF